MTSLPPLQNLALGAAAIFCAFAARGLSGFGSGMIAVPLLAFLFPLPQVVPAVALLNYLASLRLALSDRRVIAWRELLLLLPASLIGLGTAWLLFEAISPVLLRHLLGAALALQALRSLALVRTRAVSRFWAVPAGLLGGAMDGLFSVGGPIYASYLEQRGLEKSAFRATLALLLILESSVRIWGYRRLGLLDRPALTLFALALLPALGGLVFGELLHRRTQAEAFRRTVALLILASGLALLVA